MKRRNGGRGEGKKGVKLKENSGKGIKHGIKGIGGRRGRRKRERGKEGKINLFR